MSAGTLCFTIEGAALTRICRSLVLEGKWRHALHTLMTGLDGISTDQALSILKGTHCLTGANELEVQEQDPADPELGRYLGTLAWQYAGLWRRPGLGHWVPYASVICLGREDLPRDTPRELDPGRWGTLRVMYYADDPRADFATDRGPGEDAVAILWKRVPDLPLWLEAGGARESSEALREFRALAGRLEERGAIEAQRRDDPEEDLNWPSFDRVLPASPEVAATTADHLISQLGLSGKMAEAAQSLFAEPAIRAPQPDREFAAASGYILPNGDFYGCQYMGHRMLAEDLLYFLFDVEVKDPQIEADRRNWLRIQGLYSGGTSTLCPSGRPTALQERALASWCIKHQVPYPEDLKGEE